MTMILCPACSQQVSDQATSCPNCGHPLVAAPTAHVATYTNTSGRSNNTSVPAIVSLVFGLLSWCILPFIGAIVAVIAGHIARSEIRSAPAGTIDGDGMAIAGLILGWAHLVVVLLGLLFIFAVLGGFAAMSH